MKKLLMVILTAGLVVPGCAYKTYDQVHVWTGVELPIPAFPIKLGAQVDLGGKVLDNEGEELDGVKPLTDAEIDFLLFEGEEEDEKVDISNIGDFLADKLRDNR